MYELTAACFGAFRQTCEERGFRRRGKAFFRVHGDGVLQVLKFVYERGEMLWELDIGLFSMYGELKKQWFTSEGCIPRYFVGNLVGVRDADSSPLTITIGNQILVGERCIGPQEQLRILREKGFAFLDAVDTQPRLAEALLELDMRQYGSHYWIDSVKYAPFLRSGDRANAARVMQAILDQHHGAMDHMRDTLRAEDFAAYEERIRTADAPYLPLLELAKNGEQPQIDAYLQENYVRNCGYAKFCMRK